MKKLFFLSCILLTLSVPVYSFDWVIVKYRMGDWYNARDGVKNFLTELKKRTSVEVSPEPVELSLDDERIFEHYFLFINGHVPIQLNPKEKDYLRRFILNGGFVLANDDYGIDESFHKVVKEIFPDYPFEPVAFDHPIYRAFYTFPKGVPKIHEHDGGPPQAYGLFVNGRLALYYIANSDIADGWDFPEVHNDPPEVREQAIRMGVNIVLYSLTH